MIFVKEAKSFFVFFLTGVFDFFFFTRIFHFVLGIAF